MSNTKTPKTIANIPNDALVTATGGYWVPGPGPGGPRGPWGYGPGPAWGGPGPGWGYGGYAARWYRRW